MSDWLSNLRQLDWWLIGAIFLLLTISNVTLYSMGSSLTRQLLFSVLGLVVLLISSSFNYRWLLNYAYILYGLGLLMLIGVLLFGTTIRGTTGWFQIAGLTFQPVELMKIILLITFARFFADHVFEFTKWRTVLLLFIIVLGYVLPVLLQPDLGSAMIFIFVCVSLLLLTTLRWQQVVILLGVGITIVIASWFVILEDYQKDRLLTFLNPDRAPLTTGYNVSQAITATGSGQLFGRGLGLGPQSQLHFLPEREADFIFAVIAEELGFIGAVTIIGLLSYIIIQLLKTLCQTQNPYARFYLAGLAAMLFFHSLINIGMNIGIMPVTGIPLPFVSAGGSALVAFCFAIGLAQNCRRQQ